MATALVTAAAAGYSAYAQNQAGKQQRKIANRNADLLDASAADAVERGEEEARVLRRKTKSLRGQQRAALAGSGIDVGSGTALELQEETTTLGALDASQLRKNALREAWGIRTQAANTREAGAYAQRGARNQAFGTILGGAGSAAQAYYTYDAPRFAGSPNTTPAPTSPKTARYANG